MLKDSSSYERQIIDAVRSVNKALGGTCGTSSAIYKSEFNQYEVQLIDAIKGIGRTLSGKGLSVVAGSGSAIDDASFQNLSRRVTKLENESFFRLVDGNVTLKEDYQNLWVPGWLAAGGVGSDEGGGGGVSYLKELTDIYHNANGVLRSDGTAVQNGDALVYDSANSRWIAAAVSGGGGVIDSSLSPTSGNAVANSAIYAALSGKQESLVSGTNIKTINGQSLLGSGDIQIQGGSGGGGTVTSITLTQGEGITVSNSGSAITVSGSRTISISSDYQTKINNGNVAYGWGNHATAGYASASDLSSLLSRVTSIEDWFEIVTVGTQSALHVKQGRALYSDSWIAAGGVGSGSGGGSGTYVAWGTKSGNTRPLTVEGTTETLLLDGALSGYATQSWVGQQGYVTSQALNTTLAGYATNLALAGKQDKYPFTITGASGATYALGNFVTIDGAQTITGAKTFSGGITMSGANILPSADDANSLGSNDYRFNAAFIRNIYTSFFQFRDGETKAVRGNIAFGDGYLQLSLAGTNAANYMFYSGSGFFKQGGGVPLGRSDHRWSSVYSVDADLSGDLALASTSHIDIGPLRIEYDATHKALHITKKDSTDTETYGLYADGFVAAGGVQQNS